MKKTDLLDEDKKFLEIYLTNGRVGWKAYRESHPHLSYDDDKWRVRTSYYMKTKKIKAMLDEAEKRAMVRVEKAMGKYAISKERIAQELARIAFSTATDVVSFGPDGTVVKSSDDLDADVRASISEVKESRNKETGTVVSVKQYDKTAALVALGKHVGMFVEQVDHTHRVAAKLVIEG